MITLPATFVRSASYMRQKLQYIMRLSTTVVRPEICVAMTYNRTWRYITRELADGQFENARHDIVSGLFGMNMKQIVSEVIKNDIFRRCVHHVRVVEFQKRCSPYAHYMCFFEKSIQGKYAKSGTTTRSHQCLYTTPEAFDPTQISTFPNDPCPIRRGKTRRHSHERWVLHKVFPNKVQRGYQKR